MSEYFKKIDFFGTKFEFNTFKESKFKTNFGAFITLTCSIVILVFSFLFGKDFYLRKNPRILQQKIVPNDYSEPFRLNLKNMFIAWRISSYSSKTLNFTGIVYAEIVHKVYDNVKSELVRETFINYTKCSDKSVLNQEFAKYYKADIWYCLDWSKNDNLTFGGYWDNDHINYFEIVLRACPQKTFSNEGCTDKEKLKEVFDSEEAYYFDTVYQEYNFIPNDFDNPLRTQYKNYFYALNFNIRKFDRIYFKNVNLNNDIGRMFEDIRPINTYSFHELKSDYSYFKDEDYGNTGYSSELYTMVFYYTKAYDNFDRSYMKIQDLAAIVGGFLKIILLAGSLICELVCTFIREEVLYNELFRFKRKNISNLKIKK